MKRQGIFGFATAFVVTIGAFFAATEIDAQTVWPTFELDLEASSVEVRSHGCLVSCNGFQGSFGTGAENFSWTPTSATESLFVDDFFNWTTTDDGFGTERYSVQTELVFSSPDTQSASASGNGLVVQLWGDVSAGVLRWTDVASVTFAQGSTLDVAFAGLAGSWRGTVSTAATFVGNLIAPTSASGGTTSAVPLPGSLVLLLTAFGAFFGGQRLMRRRAGAATVRGSLRIAKTAGPGQQELRSFSV